MAGIGFVGISKQFGANPVVEDFDLAIEEGEFVVLVGPSGCGKTTSLRMLAGLEQPTSGRIRIGAADVTNRPAKERELAMVFQSYALYPHMSVEENIAFCLTLKRVPAEQIRRRVVEAAERLQIAALLQRKPRELSGGQRQRVAVARAIVRQPRAFLFDEPLSNLDAKLRHSARVEIRTLQQQLGTTTVYVTHDQIEAMTMADRIVVMESGRIRQVGTPMALYQEPNSVFVASFLGSPPMNCISGEIGRSEGRIVFHAPGLDLELTGAAPSARATLGIRPEEIRFQAQASSDLELQGTMNFVEALGAETLVDLVIAGAPEGPGFSMTARMAGHHAFVNGNRISAFLKRDKLRLFDAKGDLMKHVRVV